MFGSFYFTTFIVQSFFFCHLAFLFYTSIYVLVFLTSSVCNLSSNLSATCLRTCQRISLVIHLFFLFFSFCGKTSFADEMSAFLSEFKLLPLSFIKASNLFCTDTAYAYLISEL